MHIAGPDPMVKRHYKDNIFAQITSVIKILLQNGMFDSTAAQTVTKWRLLSVLSIGRR